MGSERRDVKKRDNPPVSKEGWEGFIFPCEKLFKFFEIAPEAKANLEGERETN
jgi:hypothetical protein